MSRFIGFFFGLVFLSFVAPEAARAQSKTPPVQRVFPIMGPITSLAATATRPALCTTRSLP